MTKHYKYPRTPHLPWSLGVNNDDTKLTNTRHFESKDVIITEKLDGENTSMYADHIHARSLDSKNHPSRDWVKALHAQKAHLIPEGWRVCGENLYAKHSIAYQNLSTYFYVFSIWDESNTCLNWHDTQEWTELLELELAPIIYKGKWNETKIRNMTLDLTKKEGYVVRTQTAFHYTTFKQNIAKWVRKNHVQTNQHWMHSQIIPNQLKES